MYNGAPVVNGCLVLTGGPCAATTGADGRFQLLVGQFNVQWDILVYRSPGTTPKHVPYQGSSAATANLGVITLPFP